MFLHNATSDSTFLVCFFIDGAATEIYTLSLHDALPTSRRSARMCPRRSSGRWSAQVSRSRQSCFCARSEEHTSELQSREKLVCRLLLEKKKVNNATSDSTCRVRSII